MERASCLLCGSRDSKILFEKETDHLKFKVLKCGKCSLVRTFPCPDDEILRIHDKSGYYGEKESKFIPFLQNIRCRLSKKRAGRYISMVPKIIERPKVLDIGCAEGRFLNSFLEHGCDCFGIEHLSYPGERFVNRERITYLVGDLDSFGMDKGSFDIIIMWHVLEHMDDPDQVMGVIYDLLKPNGIFIMAVPNFSSSEAKIFRQLWFHLDIPWHKYHFTEKSLACLIEKNNFMIVNKNYFCIEQGVYGLLQSLLNAMGFPKNELYELIKGNYRSGRSLSLITQVYISILVFFPSLILTILNAIAGNGSTVKLILKKSENSKPDSK